MSSRRFNNFLCQLFRRVQHLSWKILQGIVTWLLRTLLVLQRRPALARQGFVLPTVAMVSVVVVLLTAAITIRSFDRSKNAGNTRVNEAVLRASAPALDRAKSKIEALFNDPLLPRGTPPDSELANVFRTRLRNYTLADETPLKVVFDTNGDNNIRRQNAPASDPDSRKASNLYEDETLNTVWKFPVDTDNNGKFDSFTLYTILFRSSRNPVSGQFDRSRTPLEARTPPMEDVALGSACAGAGNGSGVGAGDWFASGSKLKKPFYVYAATVPITQKDFDAASQGSLTVLPATQRRQYETFRGNKGFSALEFQQDRERIPLNNNAVWSDTDVMISQSPTFLLNGRVNTNGNLAVGVAVDAPNSSINQDQTGVNLRIGFYQVSSPNSCFYEEENAKINVAGNVVAATPLDRALPTTAQSKAEVHRFWGQGVEPKGVGAYAQGINTSTHSVVVDATNYRLVASNNAAYDQRLSLLVQAGLKLHDTNNPTAISSPTQASVSNALNRYPSEVRDEFTKSLSTLAPREALTRSLEFYFRRRLRRVTFAEVPNGDGVATDSAIKVGNTGTQFYQATDSAGSNFVLGTSTLLADASYTIRPPNEWMALITPATTPTTPGMGTNVALNFSGTNPNKFLLPRQTEPVRRQQGINNVPVEFNLGDRLLVGNHLPQIWARFTGDSASPRTNPVAGFAGFNSFVNDSGLGREVQDATLVNTVWNNTDTTGNGAGVAIDSGDPTNPRERVSQVNFLPDLGDTGRGGFWEQEAARTPDKGVSTGGLRIITGAGIFVDDDGVSGTGSFPRSTRSFLPNPSLSSALSAAATPPKFSISGAAVDNIVTWPDTMPMTGGTKKNDGTNTDLDQKLTGDLLMRSTAVYHYASTKIDDTRGQAVKDRLPIACVSSYYDPTSSVTARNGLQSATAWLPDVSGGFYVDTGRALTTATGQSFADYATIQIENDGTEPNPRLLETEARPTGVDERSVLRPVGVGPSPAIPGVPSGAAYLGPKSNNGVVYNAPYTSTTERITALTTERAKLNRQARLVYPNGRIVNQSLRDALAHYDADTSGLSKMLLQDYSAIDTAICSLKILDGTLAVNTNPPIPHGAIKENALLDGREVLSLNSAPNPTLAAETTTDPIATLGRSSKISSFAANPAWDYTATDLRNPYRVLNGGATDGIPATDLKRDLSNSLIYEDRATAITSGAVNADAQISLGQAAAIRNLYDLPLESRQPLEIRVTDIDLNLLRRAKYSGTGNTFNTSDSAADGLNNDEEFLLPNSGIIYATRDDALPDASYCNSAATDTDTDRALRKCFITDSTSQTALSSTDLRLDPTRRPNGIRLVNGADLSRVVKDNNPNFFRLAEKGLVLISNLPAYVRAERLAPGSLLSGGFNLHKDPEARDDINIDTPTKTSLRYNLHELTESSLREEFTGTGNLLLPTDSNPTLAATVTAQPWNNFYTRPASARNSSFACRVNQPGCVGKGDQWRAATIVADAVNLQSAAFLDGYRDQGDYDLNNNAGNDFMFDIMKNGFWRNNFGTSTTATLTGTQVSAFGGDLGSQNSFQTPRRQDNFNVPTFSDPAKGRFGSDATYFRPDNLFWINDVYTVGTGNPMTLNNLARYRNSYLSNGVTPVQRRVGFNEYLMELCPKVPVSSCTEDDWWVRPPLPAASVMPTRTQYPYPDGLKASDVAALVDTGVDITGFTALGGGSKIDASQKIPNPTDLPSLPLATGGGGTPPRLFNIYLHTAGTTAQAAINPTLYPTAFTTDTGITNLVEWLKGNRTPISTLTDPKHEADFLARNADRTYQRYARRVAFLRDTREFFDPPTNSVSNPNKNGLILEGAPTARCDVVAVPTADLAALQALPYTGYKFIDAATADDTTLPDRTLCRPIPLGIRGGGRDTQANKWAPVAAPFSDACDNTCGPDDSPWAFDRIGWRDQLGNAPPADESFTKTDLPFAWRTDDINDFNSQPDNRRPTLTTGGGGYSYIDGSPTHEAWVNLNPGNASASPPVTAYDTRGVVTPFPIGSTLVVHGRMLPPLGSCPNGQKPGGSNWGDYECTATSTTPSEITHHLVNRPRNVSQALWFRVVNQDAVDAATSLIGTSGNKASDPNNVTPGICRNIVIGDLKLPSNLTTPVTYTPCNNSSNARGETASLRVGTYNVPSGNGGNQEHLSTWQHVNRPRPLYIHRMPQKINGQIERKGQPMLAPILHVHAPASDGRRWGGNGAGVYGGDMTQGTIDGEPPSIFRAFRTRLQVALSSQYNLVMVTGTTPATIGTDGLATADRNYKDARYNGGLNSLPRFSEIWRTNPAGASPTSQGDALKSLLQAARINGSLIQSSFSKYATAPWQPADSSQKATALFSTAAAASYTENADNTAAGSISPNTGSLPMLIDSNGEYVYRGGEDSGRSPFYKAPLSAWGFDVGLLSQTPDLFAQRFTVPPSGRPTEFVREINRNDRWVETLLCAAQADTVDPTSNLPRFNTTNGMRYAVSQSQRPNCTNLAQYAD